MDSSEILQTWINVTTKPNEATYREEADKPYATLSTAVIWIVIASIILGILNAVGILASGLFFNFFWMAPMMSNPDLPAEMMFPFALNTGFTVFSLVWTVVLTPIVTLVAFFIAVTVYFLLAKLVGGVGDYEKHTYMMAAFLAPLLVVNGAVGLIPFLGPCISLLIYFYQIVLTYLAVKTVHDLSPGKAMLVALTPIIMLMLCVILFLMMFATMLFSLFSTQGG